MPSHSARFCADADGSWRGREGQSAPCVARRADCSLRGLTRSGWFRSGGLSKDIWQAVATNERRKSGAPRMKADARGHAARPIGRNQTKDLAAASPRQLRAGSGNRNETAKNAKNAKCRAQRYCLKSGAWPCGHSICVFCVICGFPFLLRFNRPGAITREENRPQKPCVFGCPSEIRRALRCIARLAIQRQVLRRDAGCSTHRP